MCAVVDNTAWTGRYAEDLASVSLWELGIDPFTSGGCSGIRSTPFLAREKCSNFVGVLYYSISVNPEVEQCTTNSACFATWRALPLHASSTGL